MVAAHHAGAIAMGRVQEERGARDDVRRMAERMVRVQAKEQADLERIARDEGHAARKSDPMMESHTQADLTAMRSATGQEVDRLFVVHMIDHHEQGIDMMRRSMSNLQRQDLRRMAQKMIDDQEREVAEMRRLVWDQSAIAGAGR